eukprot:GILI01003997.1.p1 GENE.GILI01003997.1~~GILI01003997.1.p1  ORF type:complete len:149 (+),score=12.13 GILI01003997.1:114-560(+)
MKADKMEEITLMLLLIAIPNILFLAIGWFLLNRRAVNEQVQKAENIMRHLHTASPSVKLRQLRQVPRNTPPVSSSPSPSIRNISPGPSPRLSAPPATVRYLCSTSIDAPVTICRLPTSPATPCTPRAPKRMSVFPVNWVRHPQGGIST